jgi:hypothetical protein
VSSRASGASLEVFRPLQRSLAAPRSILRRAAGPADKPASALPRDTRALSRGGPVSRNSPLRVCAVVSGRDVEVLGVADERGWAFRPDRDQRVGRCPGRRPLAGSRRRNDRVVRGRPVDPEPPTHGRPDHTQAPPPRIRRPRRVMHRRCLSRGVPLPGSVGPATRGLVGRAGPSLGSSDGAPGVPFVRPSQVCSRRLVVHTFPCDRARVSFVPPSSARLIFVGWPAAHRCQILVRRVGRG